MSKYWMVFALFGAIGCSGNVPESANSSRDTVSEGVASDKGQPDANGGGKGDGCGGDATPPTTTDGCSKELAALAQLIAETKDPLVIEALTTKFEIVKATCSANVPDPDPCKTLLANTQAYLDEAIKTGDAPAIVAAKEKYTIAWNSCAPATDPGKPPPDKGQPGVPPGKEDPGTPPPGKDDPGAPPGKDDPATTPPAKDEDPCAVQLSAAALNLEISAKIGDIDLIIAAKEKYAAVAASCAPPANDAPPPKK